jgi:hypothetical protein
MIIPVNMTVIEWADQMTQSVDKYSDVMKLEKPEDWQFWALSVILSNEQWEAAVPNPFSYTDWREWAELFIGNVS